MTNVFATIACCLYVATLYPGLSRTLFRQYTIKFLGKYRRNIGIVSFLVAIPHLVLSLNRVEISHWQDLYQCASGLICATIFLLLSLTSPSDIQKKLGKMWKQIHALTYGLPLILIWHILVKVEVYSPFTRFNLGLLIAVFSLLSFRFIRSVLKQRRPQRSSPSLEVNL